MPLNALPAVLCGTEFVQDPQSFDRRDRAWATWTSNLGWPVQGVWKDDSDGTDVNACCRSWNGDVVATADDFMRVNLYRYPALKGCQSKEYSVARNF